MHYLGIDIGSLSCDAVVIDHAERIVASAVVPTGARNIEAIRRARNEVERQAGIDPGSIAAVVATGYGRDRVEGRLASVKATCPFVAAMPVPSGSGAPGSPVTACRFSASGVVISYGFAPSPAGSQAFRDGVQASGVPPGPAGGGTVSARRAYIRRSCAHPILTRSIRAGSAMPRRYFVSATSTCFGGT